MNELNSIDISLKRIAMLLEDINAKLENRNNVVLPNVRFRPARVIRGLRVGARVL